MSRIAASSALDAALGSTSVVSVVSLRPRLAGFKLDGKLRESTDFAVVIADGGRVAGSAYAEARPAFVFATDIDAENQSRERDVAIREAEAL